MTFDHLLLGYTVDDVVTPLAIIAMIGITAPSASVMARRLHDIGWSGWLQLPILGVYSAYLEIWFPGFSLTTVGFALMIVGMLFWLVLCLILIKDSQPHSNKYGSNPKTENAAEVFT